MKILQKAVYFKLKKAGNIYIGDEICLLNVQKSSSGGN